MSVSRRSLVIGLAYLAFLTLAGWQCHCLSGWLVFGLAPVLWLDRFLVRQLPWPLPADLLPAVLLRVIWVVLAGLPLWFMSQGMIRPSAVVLGVAASFFIFLAETAWELGCAFLDRRWPSERYWVLRARNIALLTPVLLALFVLILPLKTFHPLGMNVHNTPADLGVPYEDVQLATADGLTLTGWLVEPAAAARGSVIFCHGHGGNRSQVYPYLPWLRELGLRVLAFDFRGHGQSPGNTASFGIHDTADIVAAEQYLGRRFPDEPIFLYGASYGALVSLQALPQLTHVRGVWLESTMSRFDDLADHYFRPLPASARQTLIHFYDAVVALDCGFRPATIRPIDALQRTRLPIYFCHGTHDPLIPFAHSVELYESYEGPKHCWWIAGAGHVCLTSEHGSEYRQRLHEFFEELLRPAS